ncbi:MAG: pantetheine-phosphate adenylyltransferase [Muribaculaceae bacterium]|nr:pantetheine-phosphate adenylyltransferase [Muribaculaceae bacterium]
MATAFFAGSFNPFTRGHASIVARALPLFDSIIIGIGVNAEKPDSADEGESRAEAIRALYAEEPRVRVVVYDTLTVDAARRAGATVLLRGVRSVADFEYERTMAALNRRIGDMETLLLFAEPDLECVSSSIVRELQSYGRDVSDFLP